MENNADLSVCQYFWFKEPHFLSIGWLNKTHSFRKGHAPKELITKLKYHLKYHWEPFSAVGLHECELCIPRDESIPREYETPRVQVPTPNQNNDIQNEPFDIKIPTENRRAGSRNLFIPFDNYLYIAPELILHYIESHEYYPPEVFIKAALCCPDMITEKEKQRIDRNESFEFFELPIEDEDPINPDYKNLLLLCHGECLFSTPSK